MGWLNFGLVVLYFGQHFDVLCPTLAARRPLSSVDVPSRGWLVLRCCVLSFNCWIAGWLEKGGLCLVCPTICLA